MTQTTQTDTLATIDSRQSDSKEKSDAPTESKTWKLIEEKIELLLNQQRESDKKLDILRKRMDQLQRARETQTSIRDIATFCELQINAPLDTPSLYTMDFINAVYEFELRQKPQAIKDVMTARDDSFTAGERSSPSDPNFLSSGYFKTMLKRYIFAGKMFCEGKEVLDPCCGRGWGTQILSSYSNTVVAFDREPDVIRESAEFWNTHNVSWEEGDALDMSSFLGERRFDTATFMEAIEHFTKEDGEKIIDGISNSLKPQAAFIGTSFFPETRKAADNHASLKRDDHLYLWTKQELRETLEKYFDNVFIVDNWMFIALRGF